MKAIRAKCFFFLRPKAMLSDFGTSEEMLRGQRERTGHTGTMEYVDTLLNYVGFAKLV